MDNPRLLDLAWAAREKAYPWKSGTKVGCVLQTDTGDVYKGWNIEGLWMTSIHAEVCAVSKIPRNSQITCIAVVAKTSFFTPCGACLDWLIQFASEECDILIQGRDMVVHKLKLRELVPHYPIQ